MFLFPCMKAPSSRKFTQISFHPTGGRAVSLLRLPLDRLYPTSPQGPLEQRGPLGSLDPLLELQPMLHTEKVQLFSA